MAYNKVKAAIRFTIQSHNDNELLFFALKTGNSISPRLNKGVLDRIFNKTIEEMGVI